MLFLGASIKLHITLHSLAQDKMHLWRQNHIAQGSLCAVHGVEIYWLVQIILPLAHSAACKV